MRAWITLLAAVVILGLMTVTAVNVRGQENATGSITVDVVTDGQAIRGPATVTLLRDGRPVDQDSDPRQGINNEFWPEATFYKLEEGVYELRVEVEGARTGVVRGVFVRAGRETSQVVRLEAGPGCKVITYSAAEFGRFGKSCGADREHLNAPPDQWQFCPVCGQKLQ